ncbi:MAG: hypothetical protein QXK48_03925 [Candidatus Aenigmatarchaeota archaeon]
MKKFKIKFMVAFFATLALLFILSGYQPGPKEFVTNRTFETRSDFFFNYEIIRYPSSVSVSSTGPTEEKLKIGVVVDPWNLNFGIIPVGKNFGTRFIDLENPTDKDVKINFKVYGNISPFVNFTKNDFILHKKEKITIEVKFYAEQAKIGNYSGEIDVIIQKPKYDFLYNFWR